MGKWLTDRDELKRLNGLCKGREIDRIELDAGETLTLHFRDGAYVRLSSLGGLEIEGFKLPNIVPDERAEKRRDWCTDPNNCTRCKAPQWDQGNHAHAGIPLGRQRGA